MNDKKFEIAVNKYSDKILIMDAGGIGDLVMATPVLKALREKFAKSHITLLVVPRSAEVIKDFPYFDEIIKLNLNDTFASLRLFWKLRKRKFDMMIDLHAIETWMASLKRIILYSIITPKVKVGRNTDHRGFFLDIQVPENFLGTVHEVERKMSIPEILGAKIGIPNLTFNLSESEKNSVNAFLDKNGIQDEQFIVGINPGGFLPTRQWNKEKFIEIGRKLVQRYQARLIITGGNREKILVSKIAESLKDSSPITVTEFSLGELAVLFKRINLLITNDTGPMHIAAAVNIPIVSIFGPENYHRYRPYTRAFNHVVAIPSIPCRPCRKFECKSHECMKNISVEMVWDAITEVITKTNENKKT